MSLLILVGLPCASQRVSMGLKTGTCFPPSALGETWTSLVRPCLSSTSAIHCCIGLIVWLSYVLYRGFVAQSRGLAWKNVFCLIKSYFCDERMFTHAHPFRLLGVISFNTFNTFHTILRSHHQNQLSWKILPLLPPHIAKIQF